MGELLVLLLGLHGLAEELLLREGFMHVVRIIHDELLNGHVVLRTSGLYAYRSNHCLTLTLHTPRDGIIITPEVGVEAIHTLLLDLDLEGLTIIEVLIVLDEVLLIELIIEFFLLEGFLVLPPTRSELHLLDGLLRFS
jgi:hypothetical protein